MLLLLLLRRPLRACPRSPGFSPLARAHTFRTSVRLTTPLRRPLIAAPGSAAALMLGAKPTSGAAGLGGELPRTRGNGPGGEEPVVPGGAWAPAAKWPGAAPTGGGAVANADGDGGTAAGGPEGVALASAAV